MRTLQQSTAIETIIAAANSGQNFQLRARAGSGKTHTMIELVMDYRAKHPSHDIAMCVFNKKNAKEMQERLEKKGVKDAWKIASTIHSLGFGLCRFRFKLTKDSVNEYKVRDIIEAQNNPIYLEHGANIERLVQFAKLEGFGFFNDCQIGDTSAWYRIADHYDINGFDDTTQMDEVIAAAQHIYKVSLTITNVIDYDDMVLFPLVKNIPIKFQKDLMIVDEAQDTGRARQALIHKFVKPKGSLVVVGDDRQGIYGFAGAQEEALERWAEIKSMQILPLTVCFRCPKSVIKLAQTLVPDIEWHEGAQEGKIETLEAMPKGEEMQVTDAILCRNTAPLIQQAYALLRDGIACKVEGREIGTGLLRMVNRWKVTTIDAFLKRLAAYEEREIQKAMAKSNEAKAEEVKDRCETLRHLCNVCLDRKQNTLNDLRAFIETMFANDVKGVVTLCTYHRAKGREWKRVFLLEHAKRCPSPWAKQAWQKRQEANLAYVAFTRAQETLTFVA